MTKTRRNEMFRRFMSLTTREGLTAATATDVIAAENGISADEAREALNLAVTGR